MWTAAVHLSKIIDFEIDFEFENCAVKNLNLENRKNISDK